MTTTSCSTKALCPATPMPVGSSTTTTTTVKAKPTQGYIIVPNDNASQAVQDAFTARLTRETNANTMAVSQDGPGKYIGYWYQVLTLEQVKLYTLDPAVSSMSPLYHHKAVQLFRQSPDLRRSRGSSNRKYFSALPIYPLATSRL